MQKIKFLNAAAPVYVSAVHCNSTKSVKRIKLVFLSADQVPEQAVLLGGFLELNEHNDFVQSDFSTFTNLYRAMEDGLTFILSDTAGDIYVEPEPPLPAPEPYILSLEEVKQAKASELSAICNQAIISGVRITVENNPEHFFYNTEDQSNIDDLFQLATTTKLEQPYHCTGGLCKLYTVEQISQLYTAQKLNKIHHVTYHNQLKAYMMSLETKEEVNAVLYGDELTGEYLQNYNAMMEQAKLAIEVMISGK